MITGAQAHAEAQLKGRTPLSPRQFSLDFTQPEQLSTGRPDLFSTVASRLSAAATRAELIREAQRIEHLPQHWQREHAGRIVKRRIDEFKKR